MLDVEGYEITILKDYNDKKIDKLIAVCKAHKIQDFQKEIDRVKQLLYEARENNQYDGDDWSFIRKNISSKFSWHEIKFDKNHILYY